nr:integrase, catalytic region, zinc finger, CCHC-type, peptidase aspartic, catalytic [Tanacetum cinerariifolium]
MDESIPYDQKCKSSKELFKIKRSVGTIFDRVEHCKETIAKRTYFGHIDPFVQNTTEANFCPKIRRINADLEKFYVCLKEEMVANLRYFNSIELEVDSLRSQLETDKTQFLIEITRLLREYYYADHMNAILGVYTELDEVTNLQCDYLELLEKCKGLETELSKIKMMSKSFESVQQHAINLELELQQCKEKIKNDKLFKVNQTKDFCKEREQYFEIQVLIAQLQDKGIVISELKKLIKKLKGKFVDTKFEKSSIIRQSDAFQSHRPSILGKPAIFSNSFVRKDFSKSKSVTQTNVSNDFSKPVTAQTLPPNKKSILKNTNVLAPEIYKLYTHHNQTRTSQFKSNPMGNRVMRNNSQGKKQEVEDHRRNVKLPKNKTAVTACNDSLNAKTLNVNYVSAIKTCSWWYRKFTPSGYKWKPKSGKENVNPNLVEIVLFIVDFGCLKHMTGNLKLLINFVEKFLGKVKFRNDQIAPILGYEDLVQDLIREYMNFDLLHFFRFRMAKKKIQKHETEISGEYCFNFGDPSL